MKNVFQIALILACTATSAMASAVPEIDGSSAVSALTLLAGGILVIRSRYKR